jgi:hypothetical protein
MLLIIMIENYVLCTIFIKYGKNKYYIFENDKLKRDF